MSDSFFFNPDKKKLWKKEKVHSAKTLSDQILKGNRFALSKVITLLESTNPKQLKIGKNIVNKLYAYSGKSIRIGITGSPGVGKSTFIEALGIYLIQQLGKKVAVLAIDPSSNLSKGSILGDKTRMNLLSVQENAFIRPSPSSGVYGGVAAKTRENIILCEAAGFDIIIVETVGVGQSETDVSNLVDFFLLLIGVMAGDEIQGIKKGVMEMAHSILINKADGEFKKLAMDAKNKIGNVLPFLQSSNPKWKTRVDVCSAIENKGVREFWSQVEAYFFSLGEQKVFDIRKYQEIKYLEHYAIGLAWEYFNQKTRANLKFQQIIHQFLIGELSLIQAQQTIEKQAFYK